MFIELSFFDEGCNDTLDLFGLMFELDDILGFNDTSDILGWIDLDTSDLFGLIELDDKDCWDTSSWSILNGSSFTFFYAT